MSVYTQEMYYICILFNPKKDREMKKTILILAAAVLMLAASCSKDKGVTPTITGTWQCDTQWKIGLYDGSQRVVNLILNFNSKTALFAGGKDTLLASLAYDADGNEIKVCMIFPDSTLAGSDVRVLKGNYDGRNLTLRGMKFSLIK